MLSIGEFSKICQVSAKTLRYYDEIGLLRPEEINPENGYRYYSRTIGEDAVYQPLEVVSFFFGGNQADTGI